MSGDILIVTIWGMLWVFVDKFSSMHRISLNSKESSSKNVNSVEVEKSFLDTITFS